MSSPLPSSPEESEPLALTISSPPPKYHCGTHGDHPDWVQIAFSATPYTGAAERPCSLYCVRCIAEFLDRQSIGKQVLP